MDNEAFKQQVLGLGASLVGFSEVSDVLPADLRQLGRAVTIGVKLSDAILNGIASGPTHVYHRHYGIVNAYLDQLAVKTAMLLEKDGYEAMPTPATVTGDHATVAQYEATTPFSHKTGATKAGLGWIGKCALFVSYAYGPRLRMVTVLTDAPLEVGKPVTESECGKCRICLVKCPAQAVKDVNWTAGMPRSEFFDAEACRHYMRTAKPEFGNVCGTCVSVCPKGKRSRRQAAASL